MFNRNSKKQSIRKALPTTYDYLHSYDDKYHVYRVGNLFADRDVYLALLKGRTENNELVVEEKIALVEVPSGADVTNLNAQITVRYYADKYTENMAL